MKSEFDLFKIKHNNIPPQKGRILISAPLIQDPYFMKSTILLTEHNTDGTLGFILNKPHKYQLHELLADIPKSNFSVSYGGPVASDTLHCIHTLGEQIPGSNTIGKGLFWGGDFEYIKSLIITEHISPADIRFFLGYSGWSPLQLNSEIKENTWLVSKLSTKDIILKNTNDLWKQSLTALGGKYTLWAEFPEDPLLN